MSDKSNNNNYETAEFSGIRSQLYKEALQEYPEARKQDLEIMNEYLNPQKNQTILEVGAGSGFFSGKIAEKCNILYVSDPSPDQLDAIRGLGKGNIKIVGGGAEHIQLPNDSVDTIWSFGAMHHCFNKSEAFKGFQKILKPGGKILIVDVLSGSDLARHFDDKVAKYCITGHEASFLTREYFDSLCLTSGLKSLGTQDVDVKRKFKQEDNIGSFIYKLHAMTKISLAECLQGAKDILGVTKENLIYCLNRPLTVFMAEKEETETIEEIPKLESKNYRIDTELSVKQKLLSGWTKEIDSNGITFLRKQLGGSAYVCEYLRGVPSQYIGEQKFNFYAVSQLGLRDKCMVDSDEAEEILGNISKDMIKKQHILSGRFDPKKNKIEDIDCWNNYRLAGGDVLGISENFDIFYSDTDPDIAHSIRLVEGR